MRLGFVVFALLIGSSFVSCSTGYVGQNCPSNPMQPTTEGDGRGCKSPGYLTGTGQAGAACKTSRDCAPVCCACANGNGSAQGAQCLDGKCASADEVCCGFNTFSDICRRGPSSKSFKSCDSNADCESGLTCIRRYDVTARYQGQVECDHVEQKVCTKRCSQDSECAAYDGACSTADTCSDTNNLCFNK